MDKTLIWLLVPGVLVIFYILRVSASTRHRNYDLEEFLLAGRHLPALRFILATTTISLLGILTLPHMGLVYRSGFSYGFMGLAAIIVPLTSAFFARRLWILGRIFNPLTPAQLLGDYYRSNGIRVLTAIAAVLVALSVTVMSLRLSTSLVEGFLNGVGGGKKHSSEFFGIISLPSFVTMFLMAALLFIHTVLGGMGAILRVAAPIGVALLVVLTLVALILIDALGGFGSLFDYFKTIAQHPTTAPLFTTGAFFNAVPTVAPSNIPWPGIMVASSLIALAGLATAPAILMAGFTPTRGQSHAPAQFLASALVTGFALFTSVIIIALATRLANMMPGITTDHSSDVLVPLSAGSEPQIVIQLLAATSPDTPFLASLLTLALIMGLWVSSAVSILAAGAMVANDAFHEEPENDHSSRNRKRMTRIVITLLLILSFGLALLKPDDPLPLFLLAGAFALQLLPALAGLCYFKKLSGSAVRNGLFAGLVAVTATSTIPQGLAEHYALTMPFKAWPFSLHPAFWGLAANLGLLLLSQIFRRLFVSKKARKQTLMHQRSFHVLPDGKPLLAPGVRLWQLLAWLLAALFVVVTTLPLTDLSLTGFSPSDFFPQKVPLLWNWQLLSWVSGLALVYVVAYKLQPVFDPEQALHGSPDPSKRRFRVKAKSRTVEYLPPLGKEKK